MPVFSCFRYAAFIWLIFAFSATEISANEYTDSLSGADDAREIRIVNGDPVSQHQYPFLAAVLSGREAELSFGSEQIRAFFFIDSEPAQFFGSVIECGLSLEPCIGANGKVCSIVADFPTEGTPALSAVQQLNNCSLGGGIGAVFRLGPVSGITELSVAGSSIPAIYIRSIEGKRRLLDAILLGFNINVMPAVPETILCGGTYLGGQWVLTAAHCVVDQSVIPRRIVEPYELLVNIGAHDLAGEKSLAQPVVEILTNNYHTIGPWGVNDYALLRIEQPPSHAQGIPLVSREVLDSLAAAAAPVQVMGWGSTRVREPLTAIESVSNTSNFPRVAALTLHTVDSCRSLWRDFFLLNYLDSSGLSINQNHVCASDVELQRDSCQGDSGGPLVVTSEGNLLLAGITSFGLGCGSPNSVPGVYASVPSFSNWITNVTGLTAPENPDRSTVTMQNDNAATDLVLGGSGSFQFSFAATMLVLSLLRRLRYGRRHRCKIKG